MTHSEEPQTGEAPAMSESPWVGFVRSIAAQVTEHAPGKKLIGPIAYAVDNSWRVLAYNDAFEELFADGRVPENMFKWMVWEGREQLPEHSRYWVRRVVPQLETLLEEFPDQPELMELARWTERTVGGPLRLAGRTGPDGEIRPFIHARYGAGAMWIGAATPMTSAGRVVFAHFYEGASPEEVRRLLGAVPGRQGAA
ncbi:hypothetical protein [Kitasatospora sp. LaBMicrA B282]|uniref:MmyB family transcriptional regulator n=1 Tax=Kitasatospora sp. LaBMicrA B282 TaxID=3420949 RepID=UPI003D131779